jgi:hypothetical protein
MAISMGDNMSRQPVPTTLLLALALLSLAPPVVNSGEIQTEPGAAEKKARDALAQFDRAWKDYTNEPNFGDPRWKLKMETLVRLAKAGSAAASLLDDAAKEGSAWAPHSRGLAVEALQILRGPETVRATMAGYDLDRMDSAQVGRTAPDFALADAGGQTYRLSQFRDKKAVVLTFVIQDI